VHIYGILQLGTITNVETVLTGLASTYATISSLSAYVKTSLANTFSALQTFSSGISVTGGITLPSTTMTVPTTNQIGYQTKHTATSTTRNNGSTTFGTLTLSPIGSVWLINANTIFYSATGLGELDFSVMVGTTWDNLNLNVSIPTIGRFCAANVPAYNYQGASVCGTYTVVSGSQTICYGCYLSVNGGAQTNGTTQMTATRIA
jgi:hypothetical protein